MHEVDPQWKWELCKFNYYENIGIEDLTFAGNTQPGFIHHGNSGGDDNDYKPIGMMRLVNSWIRRVNFTNISEALSISSSANISAYDIEIMVIEDTPLFVREALPECLSVKSTITAKEISP